jgi:hypothetical protein
MRALKVTIFSAALALAAAPALAGPHWHGGGHGHGHWGGGHGYWGGPGLVFGLAGAALLAGVAADACIRYEPIYDDYGNYVGRRPVNMC